MRFGVLLAQDQYQQVALLDSAVARLKAGDGLLMRGAETSCCNCYWMGMSFLSQWHWEIFEGSIGRHTQNEMYCLMLFQYDWPELPLMCF